MPHFCSCGADEYVCQKCGRILCSKEHPSTWRPDITGHKSAGNVCPECLKRFEGYIKPHRISQEEEGLISLYEHCRRESGYSDPVKIKQYMERYYGHN